MYAHISVYPETKEKIRQICLKEGITYDFFLRQLIDESAKKGFIRKVNEMG